MQIASSPKPFLKVDMPHVLFYSELRSGSADPFIKIDKFPIEISSSELLCGIRFLQLRINDTAFKDRIV